MAMTLEQYAIERATELGFDTSSQGAQAAIAKGVEELRLAMPGAPDETIIAENKDRIDQGVQATGDQMRAAKAASAVQPVPADTGYKPSTKYSDATAAINAEFSPEARAAVKEGTKWADIGAEAGRALGLGQRMKATAQGREAVDQQFKEIKAGINAPVVDFEERRKAKLAAMEEQIKAGTADANQMKNELTRMGLEQAVAERKSAAAIAAAEADPQSITSKAMRQLALESVTDEGMRAQLQGMNAAQIKMWMPVIEKRYLKKIEDDTKRLAIADKEQARRDKEKADADERAFKAGESEKDRRARLREANIREAGANARAAARAGAAGGSGTIKPEKAFTIVEQMNKGAKIDEDTLNAVRRSQALIAEAEKLISGPDGVTTGPIVGAFFDTGLGKMLAGPNRQRVDQITGDLSNQLMMAAKGAQTEGDAQRMRAIVDMLKQSDPGPGIKAAKAALTANETRLADTVATTRANIDDVRRRGGLAPLPSAPTAANDFDAQWAKLPRGQSLVGPDGQTYTKK